MLGVRLAGARPGQARPSVADTFDLLRGAVRVRLRRAVSAPDASGWPAATAVAGFLATLLLVADGLRFAVDAPHAISRFADARAHTPFSLPHLLALYFGTAPYSLAWLVIAVLAWRGARRPAAFAACTVTAAQLLLALYGTATTMWGSAYSAVLANPSLPLALVATASLLASPGPRPGAPRFVAAPPGPPPRRGPPRPPCDPRGGRHGRRSRGADHGAAVQLAL